MYLTPDNFYLNNSAANNDASLSTAEAAAIIHVPVERLSAILNRPAPFAGVGVAMALDREACSPDAERFLTDLLGDLTPPYARKTLGKRFALAALVGDLLAIYGTDPAGYGYRLMSADSFSGHRAGRRPFRAVLGALSTNGYVQVIPGRAAAPVPGVPGVATTMKADSKLLDALGRYGITPANVSDHFRTVSEPVVLKAATKKKNVTYGDRLPGRRMRVDPRHPNVIKSTRLVNQINEFLAGTSFTFPDSFDKRPCLQRIFNNGDTTGCDYNQGGRAYAPYQSLSRKQRAQITIAGEPVCEVDISSSYHTITLMRLGYAFDASRDYYEVAGFPRIIVKLYVNCSMGQGKPIRTWPADIVKEYAEPDANGKVNGLRQAIEDAGYRYTGDLRRDFPIGKVREAVLPLFPALKEIEALGLNWAPLSFIESEAIIGAVHELCTVYQVPCLPVHDSIICPRSKESLVRTVLSRHFKKQVGVEPKLSTK